ncbi:YHS domain-containing protein [Geobacter chapellei]|uniref:YHS domain-containing protein n=1 Tax=Pelotalea chapellei TaxID=44671 RepID=A0ABS5U4P1_9BACT|nr:YHS domain-containing protein [Pelotalea chapellei]
MRLFIWGLLIYIGYRIIISLVNGKNQVSSAAKRDAAEATYRDPVCGMYVSEDDAVIGRHDGQRHFFCSHSCLEKYRNNLADKKNNNNTEAL